jgi:hypothetical protein
MIKKGTHRRDGRKYDGYAWRKIGISHHLNTDGMVFYKNQYRTLEGYIQQGGRIDRLVLNAIKPNDITILAKALYDKEKSGDVYAITNVAWEGWVKIGMAVDANDRLNGYQTSSPHRDYVVKHAKHFDDRRKAELAAHEEARKVSDEYKSEWFKLPIDTAIKIIDEVTQ